MPLSLEKQIDNSFGSFRTQSHVNSADKHRKNAYFTMRVVAHLHRDGASKNTTPFCGKDQFIFCAAPTLMQQLTRKFRVVRGLKRQLSWQQS